MGRHPFGRSFDGGGGRLVDHPPRAGSGIPPTFQLTKQLPFEIGDPLDGNLPASVRAYRSRGTAICRSTGIGLYCGCTKRRVFLRPLSSTAAVTASMSLLNLEKDSSSRYCAWSIFSVPAHPLHRLDLGVAADARDKDANVDGRAVALIEKVGIEEKSDRP